MFAQRARALGIRVIGTVSDKNKAVVARRAGCFEVINYSKETSSSASIPSPTAPEWQLSKTQSGATRFWIRCGRCDRAAPWWFSARHQVIRRPLDPFSAGTEVALRDLADSARLHRASRPTGSCGCGPVRCNSTRHPRCRTEPHLRARRHRHRSPRSGKPQITGAGIIIP